MVEANPSTGLRIAIIGATGAIGKEIAQHSKEDTRIAELIFVVRRKLDEWDQAEFKPKLTFIIKENFDSFEDCAEQLRGVDAFLCTLGTRQKEGKDVFKRVDYQYPLNFATLAKELEIPHFGLLTSSGANASSMFYYMQIKGEVERDIIALGLPQLTIYKPGLIENRRNDWRFGEALASWIPFITKIQATDLGHSMLLHTIELCTNDQFPRGENNILRLNNSEIRNGAQNLAQARL